MRNRNWALVALFCGAIAAPNIARRELPTLGQADWPTCAASVCGSAGRTVWLLTAPHTREARTAHVQHIVAAPVVSAASFSSQHSHAIMFALAVHVDMVQVADARCSGHASYTACAPHSRRFAPHTTSRSPDTPRQRCCHERETALARPHLSAAHALAEAQ